MEVQISYEGKKVHDELIDVLNKFSLLDLKKMKGKIKYFM